MALSRDWQMSLPFGGRERTFAVHLPPRVTGPARTGTPLPVVINFHGGGSNAAQQRGYSGMDAAADRYGCTTLVDANEVMWEFFAAHPRT